MKPLKKSANINGYPKKSAANARVLCKKWLKKRLRKFSRIRIVLIFQGIGSNQQKKVCGGREKPEEKDFLRASVTMVKRVKKGVSVVYMYMINVKKNSRITKLVEKINWNGFLKLSNESHRKPINNPRLFDR